MCVSPVLVWVVGIWPGRRRAAIAAGAAASAAESSRRRAEVCMRCGCGRRCGWSFYSILIDRALLDFRLNKSVPDLDLPGFGFGRPDLVRTAARGDCRRGGGTGGGTKPAGGRGE